MSDIHKSSLQANNHEFKSYKNDPEIKAMTDLVDAYQRREVHSAEKILRGSYIALLKAFSLNTPDRESIDNYG